MEVEGHISQLPAVQVLGMYLGTDDGRRGGSPGMQTGAQVLTQDEGECSSSPLQSRVLSGRMSRMLGPG